MIQTAIITAEESYGLRWRKLAWDERHRPLHLQDKPDPDISTSRSPEIRTRLERRRRRVLQLTKQGKSGTQIAAALGITVRTVSKDRTALRLLGELE